eukprot:CAMPEP_0194321304 /NCGR_PEP_ID=MMETSP0171-20130528/17523_1 /TAXON_ID=218684 /ORGANISM="Corethron pennatum, Strain L29A3" /LENGTH=156 /DNA_ID=CAMNT_0039079135 /DNA_START=1 /DNA_END=468 /DNA_ORIENTATION=-
MHRAVLAALAAAAPPSTNVVPVNYVWVSTCVELLAYHDPKAHPHLFLPRPHPVVAAPSSGGSPFAISVTGFVHPERLAMSHTLQNIFGRGCYTETLMKDNTHLVVATGCAAGRKVDMARKWGVQIVDADWMWRAAKRGSADGTGGGTETRGPPARE